MKTKQLWVSFFAVCFLALQQPVPVHAGFFLFNIIQDIFKGGAKTNKTQEQTNSPNQQIIKYGMKNSQVVLIQQHLIKAAYLRGSADGVFGYQTQQAVLAFQKDSGLTADGIVGLKTFTALKNFKGKKPVAKTPNTSPVKQKPQPARSVKPKPKPPVNKEVPAYLYELPMIATAYTRYDEGCTDYTYNGTYLRRGLVAVDPNIIPLGTRLYIPGYGEALADDIGGAIQGNRIDLAMDTLDEAFDWGVQHTTVYVLSNG